MAVLQITLFGTVQLRWDGKAEIPNLPPIIQTLLAYLIINRHRTHPREILASLMWGDSSHHQARNCLNTAVWRLRKVLEPQGIPSGTYLLSTPMGELGFNAESDYWLDVDVFEEQARHTLSCPIEQVNGTEIQALENAIHLYVGELLEGQYDDWALRERERIRCYYLNCLNYLMSYYAIQNSYEVSLEYGRLILSLDPLREEIHRKMMTLYLKNGQRSMAVRQYEQCVQVLKSDLMIAPMAETQELYQNILSENLQNSQSLETNPDKLQLAMRQVQNALVHLEHAQHELQQAADTVNKLANRDNK